MDKDILAIIYSIIAIIVLIIIAKIENKRTEEKLNRKEV